MVNRSSIDLSAVLQHRDRLPALKLAMRDDLETARARIRATLKEAATLEEDASEKLDQLYRDSEDEDTEISEQDFEDSEKYLRECREYTDEVREHASRTQLLIEQLERAFDERFAAARADLNKKLEQYGTYELIGVNSTAGTRSTSKQLSSPTSVVAVPSKLGGTTSLPQLPSGYAWVSLDSLRWNEVPSRLAFQKASRDDIEAMMKRFASVIMPMLRDPRGVSRDQLVQLDSMLGMVVSQSQSLAFTWDCLLGSSDPIALTAPHPLTGPHYGWTSGRHRALVAKSLGWTHIPARVV